MSHTRSKTYLEINLDNLEYNVHLIKSKLDPDTLFAGVVKANCYGLGLKPITSRLFSLGIHEFYISQLLEGIALRGHLPDATIFCLNSIADYEFNEAVLNNIIPCLNTFDEVRKYALLAKSIGKQLPALIFFETGMGRCGLQKSEAIRLASSNLLGYLNVRYIISHLACADTPGHRMNASQLDELKDFIKLFPGHKVSFANSGGVLLGKNYHFDQVRVGCALYGINPTPSMSSDLIQVAHLYGRVLFVRVAEKEMSISYGARYRVPKGSKIATVECGYGDGYTRILTGNSHVYYAGYILPLIGMITMDMVMVDVSQVPDSLLEKMSHVEFFGDNIDINDLAGRAQTIGNEIFTSLGNRLERIYTSKAINKITQPGTVAV